MIECLIGIFVQLPTLANNLPEGWAIGSYLGLVIQFANIFVLLFLYVRKKFEISETIVIYILLIFGAIITALTGFFWHHTSTILNREHSTALLTLTFFGGAIDCLTSVVFWPYVSGYFLPLPFADRARYKTVYSSALATGEGMSGGAVSLIGFIQNQGRNENFSTRDFFFITAILMILSLVAFSSIHFSKAGKMERVEN